MPTPSQIAEMVRPIVEAKGAFVVDVAFGGDRNGKILEIFVDTDEGVTTSLCAEISHELSKSLNIDALFRQRYQLVVSSPGLDRPLKYVRQYSKNVGRNVRVKYQEAHEVKTIDGELTGTDERGIRVKNKDGEDCAIAFSAIVETRVNAEW